MSMLLKRPNIVEGLFYFEEKDKLSTYVKTSLNAYSTAKEGRPFGIITPFGSYLYAAKAFAASYSQVIDEEYDSVIIIAPIHKMSFYGIALSESDCFSSPLGDLYIDKEANQILHNFNSEFIYPGEKYHLTEHSIEVQLPFISTALSNDVKIVPIIIGESNTKFTILLTRAIKHLMEKTNKKYLVIVTTNLSHEVKHDKAVEVDHTLIEILKTLNADYLAEQLALNQITAYGGGGLITLLRLANTFGLDAINILKYFTSGDISNDKLKVEGYLSAVIYQ
ncbi:MAG: AmmeMemoRadiSam system protein B [Spirochaetes bacterium]|nr:AmmeMemoRadiSam system protein B [Spirochaetota bacterium]